MNHFGDTGYKYHTVISQLWGVTALRLANADLLPFDFATYAGNIRQFVNDLTTSNIVILSGGEAGARDRTTAKSKAAVDENTTMHPAVILTGAPSNERAESKDLMSPLDLHGIESAIDAFESAGKKLNASLTHKLSQGSLDPKLASDLNHGMMQLERNWLNPDGIPGRPWFKHILYGARFTYAHLELPGLTEAVEKQDWSTARQQAAILQHALEKNTKLLNELNDRAQQ